MKQHRDCNDAVSPSDIQALARWIFADDPSLLSYEKLKSLHLGALTGGILRERLPQEITASAKKQFLQLQARDLAQGQIFHEIARLFAKNQIPFCPIKGADLSNRVYPHGALRPRGDLDILIRREDRKRTLAVLRDAGWTQPYRYVNPNHEADMFRHGICLELHHKLPNFAKEAMPEVWKHTVEDAPFCHHLDLEFNLLMLFQHSAGHDWLHAVTLLLDCAFLLKKEGAPDWEKIHSAARVMHLYDPALFFRAFSDFFPDEMMPPENFPPEICARFRRMLLTPAALPDEKSEKVMRESARFSLGWWKARFNGLRLSVIRYKTGNPRGNYLKLWRDYFVINGGKFCAFLRGLGKLRRGEFQLREPDEKVIKNFLAPPKKDNLV